MKGCGKMIPSTPTSHYICFVCGLGEEIVDEEWKVSPNPHLKGLDIKKDWKD